MTPPELRAMAILARWLGPWADSGRAPDVDITDDQLDELRVRIYRPHRPTGRTFAIAPGLHYAGPDDPRMDRFCRILAAAGHLVVAPFIPDFLALAPSERAKRDFLRVLRAMPRWSSRWSPSRPVVFSISFGSLLAFAAAAEHPALVERLVVFGGYADLRQTLAFCLTGELPSGRRAARDPLNQPVVLMNLIDLIDPPAVDRAAVLLHWRRYVERTWGRPEMKAPERFAAVAMELLDEVPPSVRELFLVGIGVTPGARELALAALERFDARALDPAPYLPHVRGPVTLVHGVDDDVIPFEHSHALAAALRGADVHVHVTGMYGHTGAAGVRVRDGARELSTMLRVLRALV